MSVTARGSGCGKGLAGRTGGGGLADGHVEEITRDDDGRGRGNVNGQNLEILARAKGVVARADVEYRQLGRGRKERRGHRRGGGRRRVARQVRGAAQVLGQCLFRAALAEILAQRRLDPGDRAGAVIGIETPRCQRQSMIAKKNTPLTSARGRRCFPPRSAWQG